MILQNLVITGGASGIGAMTVDAALARGWNVALCDMLPAEKVNPALLTDRTSYTQCDVTNPDAVNNFRREALSFFEAKGAAALPLAAVANAGISHRGSPEADQRTRNVNAGGIVNLLSGFREPLVSTKGTFVSLSSIVAAENHAIQGDEVYKETKDAAWKLADAARLMGIQAFAVFPGAVDTPLTQKEVIFAMSLMGVVKVVGGEPEHPLHQKLLEIAGVTEGATLAAILTGAYGPELTRSPEFEACAANFPKYPMLNDPAHPENPMHATTGIAYSRFTSHFVDVHGKKVRQGRPQVIARAAEVLKQLDVVIGPETVAGRLVAQLESGQIPAQGMLKVYSVSGTDYIQDRRLLKAIFGG